MKRLATFAIYSPTTIELYGLGHTHQISHSSLNGIGENGEQMRKQINKNNKLKTRKKKIRNTFCETLTQQIHYDFHFVSAHCTVFWLIQLFNWNGRQCISVHKKKYSDFLV